MNSIVKDNLKYIYVFLSNVISGGIQTVASILRIFVLSSIKVSLLSRGYYKNKKFDKCIILANGPSLKDVLDHNEIDFREADVVCVNNFCESHYFKIIRPRYYVLVDPEYFSPSYDRTKKIVDVLLSNLMTVNWKMFLVIPSYVDDRIILKKIKSNHHVSVLKYNSTEVGGYFWFCKNIYDLKLGMPKCINVANMAIMSAIISKYKEIYLYGVDHSWMKDLFVDDDNVLCYGDFHVYDSHLKVIKLANSTIAKELGDMAEAFRIHSIINKYAITKSISIINCTKGSYIDAYKRL